MSQHTLSCIIILRNQTISRILEAVLRKVDFNISLHYAKSWQDFENHLAAAPALVFSPGDFLPEQENRVLEALQQHSPDTVLVKVSPRRWEALAVRMLGVEVCTVSYGDTDSLHQQVDALLHYASLKSNFRQCKHLLSVAELRCQWLVDYSREPVAFVRDGRHLHANVAYLSLFGLHSEAEALAMPLLRLVKKDEREIFRSVSAGAELGTVPTGRLLITLCRVNQQVFRAEIRFIPTVFRGRRCVQLHVHPVHVASNSEQRPIPGPWDRKRPGIEAEGSPGRVGTEERRTRTRLYAAYQESLNLRAAGQPGLLIAEPYLQTAGGKRIGWARIQADADRNKSRYRLDWWSIRSALLHPQVQAKNSQLQILVSLGAWLYTNPSRFKELVKLLHKNQRLAQQLILAIRVEDYASHAAIAQQILPALRSTGVQLAFDNVLMADPQLIQQIQACGAGMVRLHPSRGHNLAKLSAVPQELQALIQAYDQEGIKVIVTGIKDIASLNLLCVTPAAYLQGEILGRFSR